VVRADGGDDKQHQTDQDGEHADGLDTPNGLGGVPDGHLVYMKVHFMFMWTCHQSHSWRTDGRIAEWSVPSDLLMDDHIELICLEVH